MAAPLDFSLAGKTAIVTGAATGIGRAIAGRFIDEGMRVVIADIDQERGRAALDELSARGEARFVKTDVAKRLDVHNLVAHALDQFGEIDVLVNNAGVIHAAAFLDLAEEDFDRVLSINLKGAFLCSQAVARHMVEKVQNGGEPDCIVNMSSVNSVIW